MRITKRSNIALRVLMFCAANPDRLVTKSEIALRCNTSESHLAQVINRLAQLGYLHTQRGRSGGITLNRKAPDILIGDIFRSLEHYEPGEECFADVDNSCPLISACRLRIAIRDAAEAFFAHLDGITLDSLVCGNDALFALFSPPGCASAKARRIDMNSA
jgi:Rrf2 family nitric oxide-sensitive transcriptional repressor